MKATIHPPYFPQAQIKCSCGNVIITGSTKEHMKIELCSACHPFYTGTQRLVDTAGRVERFKNKAKAAELMKQAKKQAEIEKKISKEKKPEEKVGKKASKAKKK